MKHIYTFLCLFLLSGIVVGDEKKYDPIPLCELLDCSKLQIWNCVVDERVHKENGEITITNRNTDLYEIKQYEEIFFLTNLMSEETFSFWSTTRLDIDDAFVNSCYLSWPFWECSDRATVFSLNEKTGRAYLVNKPMAWLFADPEKMAKYNPWAVETLNCIKR